MVFGNAGYCVYHSLHPSFSAGPRTTQTHTHTHTHAYTHTHTHARTPQLWWRQLALALRRLARFAGEYGTGCRGSHLLCGRRLVSFAPPYSSSWASAGHFKRKQSKVIINNVCNLLYEEMSTLIPRHALGLWSAAGTPTKEQALRNIFKAFRAL